mgnify:CR=1 FL=1
MMHVKMGEGFDQIGKKNMMRVNRLKRQQYAENKMLDDDEAKMNEFTHII